MKIPPLPDFLRKIRKKSKISRVGVDYSSIGSTDYSPNLRQPYQVWVEGYNEKGGGGNKARLLHHSVEATSFTQACLILAEHSTIFAKDFNELRMEYQGCRLYDNEKDARRYYG